MTAEHQKQRDLEELRLSLSQVASSPGFPRFMRLLQEEAFWGQSSFDAAQYDPWKAAVIDGMKNLVTIIENQIKAAKTVCQKQQPRRRKPRQPRA